MAELRRSSFDAVKAEHTSLLESVRLEALSDAFDGEDEQKSTVTLSAERNVDKDKDDKDEEDDSLVPDGGWGWIVCLGSFVVNFILDGTLFSFGVLMLALLADLGEDKSTTSWIGSTQMGIHMIMGPVISILLRNYSIRQVTIAGTLITFAGFVASVFAPNVYVLIFTYGFIGGIGIGMVFLPAIIVVGLYFNKKRAIATGIASSGSGFGTFAFAYIADVLLENFNWRGTILILSGLVLHCVICGMLFRPLVSQRRQRRNAKSVVDIPESSSGYSSDPAVLDDVKDGDSSPADVTEVKGQNKADHDIFVQSGDGVCNHDNYYNKPKFDTVMAGSGDFGVAEKICGSNIGDPVVNAADINIKSQNDVRSPEQKPYSNSKCYATMNDVDSKVTSQVDYMCQPGSEGEMVQSDSQSPELHELLGSYPEDHTELSASRREVNDIPAVIVSQPHQSSVVSENNLLITGVNKPLIQPVSGDTGVIGNAAISSTDVCASHVSLPDHRSESSKNQHYQQGGIHGEADYLQVSAPHHIQHYSHHNKNKQKSTVSAGNTAKTGEMVVVDPRHFPSPPFAFLKDDFHRLHHIMKPHGRLYTSLDHLHHVDRKSGFAHHQQSLSPRMMRSEYKLNDFLGSHARSPYGLKSYCDHHDHSGVRTDYHNQICRGLLRPILRKDIYYSGSVSHLPAYHHYGSLTSFVAAMTRASSSENADVITAKDGTCVQRSSFCRKFNKLFPLALITNRLFLLLLITFTMWTAQSVSLTYMPDLAVSMGINRSDAAFLISIVGITNVMGRLFAGFITDCFHVPSIWLYFVALSVATVINLVIPFCQEYIFLQLCSAVFGLCMAVAVSMRTIVLAEQLGIEVLTESFGMVALFQGSAFTINPPIAGKLIDDFHSFKPPFIMAGIMYAISALATLWVACLNKANSRRMRSQMEVMEIKIDADDGGSEFDIENRSDAGIKMGEPAYL